MTGDPGRMLRYVIELDEDGFDLVIEIGDAGGDVFAMRLRPPAGPGRREG